MAKITKQEYAERAVKAIQREIESRKLPLQCVVEGDAITIKEIPNAHDFAMPEVPISPSYSECNKAHGLNDPTFYINAAAMFVDHYERLAYVEDHKEELDAIILEELKEKRVHAEFITEEEYLDRAETGQDILYHDTLFGRVVYRVDCIPADCPSVFNGWSAVITIPMLMKAEVTESELFRVVTEGCALPVIMPAEDYPELYHIVDATHEVDSTEVMPRSAATWILRENVAETLARFARNAPDTVVSIFTTNDPMHLLMVKGSKHHLFPFRPDIGMTTMIYYDVEDGTFTRVDEKGFYKPVTREEALRGLPELQAKDKDQGER